MAAATAALMGGTSSILTEIDWGTRGAGTLRVGLLNWQAAAAVLQSGLRWTVDFDSSGLILAIP